MAAPEAAAVTSGGGGGGDPLTSLWPSEDSFSGGGGAAFTSFRILDEEAPEVAAEAAPEVAPEASAAEAAPEVAPEASSAEAVPEVAPEASAVTKSGGGGGALFCFLPFPSVGAIFFGETADDFFSAPDAATEAAAAEASPEVAPDASAARNSGGSGGAFFCPLQFPSVGAIFFFGETADDFFSAPDDAVSFAVEVRELPS